MLRIPSLGIDGEVVPVGIDKDGNMGVPPAPSKAGWYRLGPILGHAGDAVLDCHNVWYGNTPALCYNLHDIAPRADIYTIGADGTLGHWRVEGIDRVPYSTAPAGLFDSTGSPRLSIITCDGIWDATHQTFAERVIVHARPADS
jgi:hypothetical protein